ncbi:hypothetical protein R7S55_003460 [Raoultella ornithinolytica]|uniref:hypothetical protein n=1 Tax=Klebsiella quasipneumoniae TaxID=1463165 RepID=UPI00190E8336|nr:hypothetical protein [Klebsiella quasipneumoniae]ELT0601655.1 hypothetical protein [Raoultella ornithinolytica]ELT0733427.1 hypothetical protein [Raoultella ornithinolytica]HCH7896250.1 hypothetical protein [Raoultella ornithinolytica]HDT0534400.1 hypothetical protein [Klebsiella quasipneumoniae subsp. similipneumoniae]
MNLMMGVFGSSNRGKSETLIFLIKLFEQSERYESFMATKPHPGGEKDLMAVFERDGLKIGISTLGDLGSQVEKSTKELAEMGCNVIITATRTRNKTVVAFETVAEEFSFKKLWFEKNNNVDDYCNNWPSKQAEFETIKINHFNQSNMMDASFIFSYIDGLPG